MKRRDFVKSTALTAIGASMLNPLEAFANHQSTTHLESDDISPLINKNNGFPINFLALGDWGRNGEYHQQEVAKQMGIWAAANPNDFNISVGDNFYPKGVVSETDPLWHYSFENVYTAHSLQGDWHPVLGNHDHLSNPDAQVRYSKVSRRWDMPALYYSKEISMGKEQGTVLFVMLDTDPMLFEEKADYTKTQLEWLNHTLQNASANIKWKIVIGHHPYYTVGPRIENYDTLTIRKILPPIFEKHQVDIYLSGHEHSLQHIKPDGYTHQFISGAGSELSPITSGVKSTRFAVSDNGFMYFSIGKNTVAVKAINYEGKILYETAIKK